MQIVLEKGQLVKNEERDYEGSKYRTVQFQSFRPDGGLDVIIASASMDCPGLANLETGVTGVLTLDIEFYLKGFNQKAALKSVRNGKAPAAKA